MSQEEVSKTYNSYHLWGLAVDLVPKVNGQYTWDNKQAYKELHDVAIEVIQELGLKIDNGFDLWGWDMPHWQMTGRKREYDFTQGGFLN